MPQSYKTILVTGAAGQLGKLVREALRGQFNMLRLSDIAPMAPAAEGEALVICDLANPEGVADLVKGVDAVIHLGASLNVDDWQETLQVNIQGTYNLFNAAQKAGVKRMVYASSHHVVGMYPTSELLDHESPLRPDSLYGLSKCFGENTARYFWDKFGLESVCLRIGSTRPKPSEARELSTWLSESDFKALVLASLAAPRVEFSVVYGVSNNEESWWSNEHAAHLSYRPQDSADAYRVEIRELVNAGKSLPDYPFQGGKRASYGLKVPHEKALAAKEPRRRE